MAKVLLINGSGNEHGCTFTALSEAARALNEEGVETEIIQLGKDAIRDCIGCGSCGKLGRCVFDDDQVNLVAAKAKEADGGCFLSWTGCSIPQAARLRTNRELPYFPQDAAELRHPLMC